MEYEHEKSRLQAQTAKFAKRQALMSSWEKTTSATLVKEWNPGREPNVGS